MKKRADLILLLILGLALFFRLALAFAGLQEPGIRLVRPDTATYLDPANAMLSNLSMGSGRAPGFIVLAAAVKKLFPAGASAALALILSCISIVTVALVYVCGELAGGRKTGLLAAVFAAFNLTALANAPLFLSDTLFAYFAALQLIFFLYFVKTKKGGYFLFAFFLAAAAALIRPINLPWFLPGLFLLGCIPRIPWKKKVILGLAGTVIFAAVLFPWMQRNARRGAGWCIDTNTGAMLHQNGAMILSAVKGTPYEEEKRNMLKELDRIFQDKKRFPDEASVVRYRKEKLKEILLAHPFIAFRQHLNWHHILLPDAPGFFELLGVTKSDRGTMSVLKQKGLFAAVSFYFDGRWYLPLALFPLLVLYGIMLIGAGAMLVWSCLHFRKHWRILIWFGAFCEFYLFLPGPICAPRYQLPALPCAAVLAALFFRMLYRRFRRQRTVKSSGNLPGGEN